MRWGAIVVAAGRGTRFGRPKQLVEIAGKPMLAWSIEAFAALDEVVALVVTTEGELIERVRSLVREHAPQLDARVVRGGAQRQDSVRLGLAALPPECEAVFVHDGARPLVRIADVRRGMAAVGFGTASFLCAPVVDTIKEIDERGRVVSTPDRGRLRAAQTPQFALLEDLRRVHDEAHRAGALATDDATLLERAGITVIAVEGDAENFKVTLPADQARAELLLRERGTVVAG